jgi:hypothetical protein
VGAAVASLVARRVTRGRLKTILAGTLRLGPAPPIHRVVRILLTVAATHGRAVKVSAAEVKRVSLAASLNPASHGATPAPKVVASVVGADEP